MTAAAMTVTGVPATAGPRPMIERVVLPATAGKHGAVDLPPAMDALVVAIHEATRPVGVTVAIGILRGPKGAMARVELPTQGVLIVTGAMMRGEDPGAAKAVAIETGEMISAAAATAVDHSDPTGAAMATVAVAVIPEAANMVAVMLTVSQVAPGATVLASVADTRAIASGEAGIVAPDKVLKETGGNRAVARRGLVATVVIRGTVMVKTLAVERVVAIPTMALAHGRVALAPANATRIREASADGKPIADAMTNDVMTEDATVTVAMPPAQDQGIANLTRIVALPDAIQGAQTSGAMVLAANRVGVSLKIVVTATTATTGGRATTGTAVTPEGRVVGSTTNVRIVVAPTRVMIGVVRVAMTVVRVVALGSETVAQAVPELKVGPAGNLMTDGRTRVTRGEIVATAEDKTGVRTHGTTPRMPDLRTVAAPGSNHVTLVVQRETETMAGIARDTPGRLRGVATNTEVTRVLGATNVVRAGNKSGKGLQAIVPVANVTTEASARVMTLVDKVSTAVN